MALVNNKCNMWKQRMRNQQHLDKFIKIKIKSMITKLRNGSDWMITKVYRTEITQRSKNATKEQLTRDMNMPSSVISETFPQGLPAPPVMLRPSLSPGAL